VGELFNGRPHSQELEGFVAKSSAKLCGKTTCTKPPVSLLLTTNQPRTISLRPEVAGSRSRSGLIIAWQPRGLRRLLCFGCFIALMLTRFLNAVIS
jgi:hypothetical protein